MKRYQISFVSKLCGNLFSPKCRPSEIPLLQYYKVISKIGQHVKLSNFASTYFIHSIMVYIVNCRKRSIPFKVITFKRKDRKKLNGINYSTSQRGVKNQIGQFESVLVNWQVIYEHDPYLVRTMVIEKWTSIDISTPLIHSRKHIQMAKAMSSLQCQSSSQSH